MPMIDVYATTGTFADAKHLTTELATTLMRIEGVPDIPMFRQNTAAFIHEIPPRNASNVDGDNNHVRVQVLTNAGGLSREKQIAVVARLTELIAEEAGNPPPPERIWVLLTEAIAGGWGLWGHAHTNADLVAAARSRLARDGS